MCVLLALLFLFTLFERDSGAEGKNRHSESVKTGGRGGQQAKCGLEDAGGLHAQNGAAAACGVHGWDEQDLV